MLIRPYLLRNRGFKFWVLLKGRDAAIGVTSYLLTSEPVPCMLLIQSHKCCLWAVTMIHVINCIILTKGPESQKMLPTNFQNLISRLWWKLHWCYFNVLNQNLFWGGGGGAEQECGFLFFVILEAFKLVFFDIYYYFCLSSFYLLILWQYNFFNYLMWVHLCTNENRGSVSFEVDS